MIGGGDTDARLEEMRRQFRDLALQREKEKELEREQQKKRESEDLLRTKRDAAIKEVEYLRVCMDNGLTCELMDIEIIE